MRDLALQYFYGLATFDNLLTVAITLGYVLLIALPVLGAMAYLTLAERKVLGWMHLRHGPLYVGPWGLLQPIADALLQPLGDSFVALTSAQKVLF